MRKMISYIHHLKEIFEELGILYNTKNKKDMHVLMQQFTQESEDKKIWEYIKPYVTEKESNKELIEFIKRNWGENRN